MLPGTEPFERHADAYDAWFQTHRWAFLSEVEAIRLLWDGGLSLEVGVGSGIFATILDVPVGLDPSPTMLARAARRGIRCILGQAEHLPFRDESFESVLMVTTICFVQDPQLAIREAARVLEPGGSLVVGFVDAESPLGKEYRRNRTKSRFYAQAKFYGVAQVLTFLEASGLRDPQVVQTLSTHPDSLQTVESPSAGWGSGSFVVISATKGHR